VQLEHLMCARRGSQRARHGGRTAPEKRARGARAAGHSTRAGADLAEELELEAAARDAELHLLELGQLVAPRLGRHVLGDLFMELLARPLVRLVLPAPSSRSDQSRMHGRPSRGFCVQWGWAATSFSDCSSVSGIKKRISRRRSSFFFTTSDSVNCSTSSSFWAETCQRGRSSACRANERPWRVGHARRGARIRGGET